MYKFLSYVLIAVNIAAVFLIFIIQPNSAERNKKRLKDMRPWLLAQTPYETTTSASPTPENESYQNNPSSTQDGITSTEYNAPPTQETPPAPLLITPLITPPAPAPAVQNGPQPTPPPHPSSPAITAIWQLIKKIESVFEVRVQGIRRAPARPIIQNKKFNADIARLIKFFSPRHP